MVAAPQTTLALVFKGRILSDFGSTGFSALHHSVPAAQELYMPGKHRSYLRKDTCGTSENLES